MIYVIINTITTVILTYIFIRELSNPNWSICPPAFFADLRDLLLGIFPIVFTVVNFILTILLKDYSYIKFALAPLIIPVMLLIYGIYKSVISKLTYNKNHNKVMDKTVDFLKDKKVIFSDIIGDTIYVNPSLFKLCTGKSECNIHLYIKNIYIGDDNYYDLMEKVSTHLKSCFPKMCFNTIIHGETRW